jgi:hypothetical protein
MATREIKFKVLIGNETVGIERLNNGHWVWMDFSLNPDIGERWALGVYGNTSRLVRKQFTGEKDSAGKEAYESDVVIAEFARSGNMNGNNTNPYKTKCVIIFENGSFLLQNIQKHSSNSRNWFKRTFSNHELKGFEIIGNSIANPELLKS